MALYVSLLQMICFSPLVSLNFLSGTSYLDFKDLLSILICIIGILMYLQSTRELNLIKNPSKDRLIEHLMHPDYLGNLIFLIGLFLLSAGATGGAWSIIGLKFLQEIQNYIDGKLATWKIRFWIQKLIQHKILD